MPDFQHEIGLKSPKTPKYLDNPSNLCTFAVHLEITAMRGKGLSLTAKRRHAEGDTPNRSKWQKQHKNKIINSTTTQNYGNN